MTSLRPSTDYRGTSIAAHLLGVVDFDACLALQQRLVYETATGRQPLISLLVCEHPLAITIGRQGSRQHLHVPRRDLVSRQIDVRWINRGGGCVLHAPGQLAIYPIVPLDILGWTVADYLARLQSALVGTIAELNVVPQTREGLGGVWLRGGQVAAIGASVKSWTTYHGAFLNVAPATDLFRGVHSDHVGEAPMTSLLLECQRPVKMPKVREALVRHLTEAFECERCHMFTGHPLLTPTVQPLSLATRRVG